MVYELPEMPEMVDTERPNPARIYDAMLGGSFNFAADREVVERMLPTVRAAAAENRSFLRRAVLYMAEQGIDQFLDLGSGIPTVGNVHTVARRANPAARVVYVDNEPVAVAHARHLLADVDGVRMVDADIRRPDAVLGDAATTATLDLSRPVGVLMVAVLHFVPDADDPAAIIGRYLDAVPAGSHLAVSHWSMDAYPPAKRHKAEQAVERYRDGTQVPFVPRTAAELERLLSRVQLVDPGLVWIPAWRPDKDSPLDIDAVEGYAAVGRLPG
jgi:SAM-dependent methyltransferase